MGLKIAVMVGAIVARNLPRGECIHQQHDAFGRLQVMETETTRSLYFEDASVEQGRLNMDAPMQLPFEYQQVIEAHIMQFQQTQPLKRILMLGMGSGSIATHLHMLFPSLTLHIVELRQAVIDIAYDYFYLPDVPEIEAIQEDALCFMQGKLTPYDVIIVDLFDDYGIPEAFTKEGFQQDLLNNLSPSGQILFNLWNNQTSPAQQQTQTIIDYWQMLSHSLVTQKIQVNSCLIPSTENIILSIQT